MLAEVEMRDAMDGLNVSDALRFISDRALTQQDAMSGLLAMCGIARHHSVVGRLYSTLERLLDQGVRSRGPGYLGVVMVVMVVMVVALAEVAAVAAGGCRGCRGCRGCGGSGGLGDAVCMSYVLPSRLVVWGNFRVGARLH